MRKSMIYSGLALGIAGGVSAYLMMNKKARKKMKDVTNEAVNNTASYISKKSNMM